MSLRTATLSLSLVAGLLPAIAIQAQTATAGTVVREAPANWQLLDLEQDHYPGASVERAYRELLAGTTPKKTIVVAVIDGGVDTAHADLRANLWTNPREVAGNHADDDRNGYADDLHGWDFIGGADGKDVNYDTFELTRLYARCTGAQGPTARAMPPMDAAHCATISADFQRKHADAVATFAQVQSISAVMEKLLPVLRRAVGGDSLSPQRVAAIVATDSATTQARDIYLHMAASGVTPDAITEAVHDYSAQVNYGLNPDYDPRAIVGDNYADVAQRSYGNGDVTGPEALHGTHVAGIIGAVRGNGIGIDGIASAVRIMSVRVVPNGDERDKDIANGIRYAVDNGANIINMSFGKSYSPFKSTVDDAVKYAQSKGVLMVHAGGNDGADISTSIDYPNRNFIGGGSADNWIEVGASSWRGGDTLAVNFSNYSKDQLDLFAPGEDILSTVQGGGYQRLSGTSMAAPVVTGVAALVLSYYPNLTAPQLKRVLVESATPLGDRPSLKPGAGDGTVPFGSLSRSGGIVNAYAALKLAARISAEH